MNLVFYIIFNFILYSFIGWIIEGVYSFFTRNKFIKDGFLFGPFKPMYGIAMTLLIMYHEVLNVNGISMLILLILIPTTVEYISGYILKNRFNKIYWNYLEMKYNIHGYVCFRFSIYWTILSCIGIYYLQPLYRNFYNRFEIVMSRIILILFCILLIDIYYTLKICYIEMNEQ